ncbi:MAG TPA: hypothetical protein VFD30_15180 [Terriglobia bacterium]|nr:hypothetical protein [Terriglobia bacterium]
MGAEVGRDTMLHTIRESLHKAEAQAVRLRRRDSRFVYTSLVASSTATLVAGVAAALGPMLGKGPPAWKLTCGVVAGLTACATLLSGIHKQLAVPERLGKATACIGKLRALEIDLTLAHRDIVQVAKEYQELAVNYPEFIL